MLLQEPVKLKHEMENNVLLVLQKEHCCHKENLIFIPKEHFTYGLTPDIYVVLLLADNYVKLLGFFEPKLINKNNQNDNYYFIEKEKLSNQTDLKKYIEKHQEAPHFTQTEILPASLKNDAGMIGVLSKLVK